MLCPVDGSDLSLASVSGYQMHRCVQCMGVSISGSLLRDVRAYAALEMHRRRTDVPGGRTCPSDGMAMRMLVYKGVAMEACPQCLGFWLDACQLPCLLELTGPPKYADLSKIGQRLPTLRSGVSTSDVDGLVDIFELSTDVIEAIGKLAD
jgi:Zn-finger nucleic acid-binding protein